MRTIRKSGITALTAAIALSLGLIPAGGLLSGALTATGEEVTAGVAVTPAEGQTPLAPSGWITLETGANDRVQFDLERNGTAERTQALSGTNKCALSTDGSILGFTGLIGTSTTNKISFGSDSIGVADKTNGQSCIQVGAPSEKIVLTLNATNVKDDLGPLVASSAYLDLELKQSARILATATVTGDPTSTRYFELQSGSTVGTSAPLPGGVTPSTPPATCNNSADSGPDSGVGDNCRWAISVPSWLGADDLVYFDTLTLQAVNGSFSLEGGGDGLVPGAPPADFPQRASLIELSTVADGILGCGGATDLREGSGDTPDVQVRRLENLGETDPNLCVEIPYTLRNSAKTGQFLKPLDQQVNAQFVVDFLWTIPVEPDVVVDGVATPVPADLPLTSVDFEATGGRGEIPLGWCPDPIVVDGVLQGIANPAAVVDMEPALDNKQYACIGVQSPEVVGDDVQISEQIYLIGDVRFRTP
jgi:hypothetical protein